jgi:hypothetical protein
MTNNKKILLACIGLIVAAGLLVLNRLMLGNAQAQIYNDRNEYSSDHDMSIVMIIRIQKRIIKFK